MNKRRQHGFYWVIQPNKVDWQIAYYNGRFYQLVGSINQYPKKYFIEVEKKRIIKDLLTKTKSNGK